MLVAVIFGIILVRFLMIEDRRRVLNIISVKVKDISKIKILFLGSVTAGLFSLVYFFRRMTQKTSITESFSRYLDIKSNILVMFLIPILPIYFNLRETVGLTNRIIVNNLHNTQSEIPLFFLELITFLPGKQMSPGVLFGNMVGKTQEGGLTPGMIGGLYLDFGYLCIIIPAFIVSVIGFFSFKAISNDNYKLLITLFTIQFIHLYHRGFLKLEYLFAFLVLFLYLSFSSKKIIIS